MDWVSLTILIFITLILLIGMAIEFVLTNTKAASPHGH